MGASQRRGRAPKAYKRTDERVKEDVYERLTNLDVDASEVSVEVQEGKVTLEGTVPQRWMKHTIEDIADGCAGVKDVENRIRVQSQSRASGSESETGSSSGGLSDGEGSSVAGLTSGSPGSPAGSSRSKK